VIVLFEKYLVLQLRRLVNQELTITVGEELYRGTLLYADSFVLRLVETTDNYERETKNVVIPLSQLSYIEVETG